MNTKNMSFIKSKYKDFVETQNITPLLQLKKAEDQLKKSNDIPKEFLKIHRI